MAEITSGKSYHNIPLFGAAYLKASTTESAINGFSKAGIFPLNRDVYTDVDFAPSDVTDQTHTCTAHSSTSDNCATNAAALTVSAPSPADYEEPSASTVSTQQLANSHEPPALTVSAPPPTNNEEPPALAMSASSDASFIEAHSSSTSSQPSATMVGPFEISPPPQAPYRPIGLIDRRTN